MTKTKDNLEILHPKEQLTLFGFDSIFNFFAKLFEKKNLPNVTLFTGYKGIGKTTFVYHLINFLLSKNEKYPYIFNEKKINKQNQSFQLTSSNIHPNFFALQKDKEKKSISIDSVRNLLSFLNKSTYKNNSKFVLIDAEDLNHNSSNALLKVLEESSANTYFFIID